MFRVHAPPQGACENLACARILLANVLVDDNEVGTIFEGLQEQSRLKNHEQALKVH